MGVGAQHLHCPGLLRPRWGSRCVRVSLTPAPPPPAPAAGTSSPTQPRGCWELGVASRHFCGHTEALGPPEDCLSDGPALGDHP